MTRWTATIHYRAAAGVVDVVHDLDEIVELQDLVERGPHWDTIDRIDIVRSRVSMLTVEQAARQ